MTGEGRSPVGRHAVLAAGFGTFGVLGLDQLSKHLASSGQLGRWLAAGGEVGRSASDLISSGANGDFIFGLDLGLPLWLAGIAVVATTGLWSALVLRSDSSLAALASVVLVVPSVVSNFVDRVMFGYVRDWLSVGPMLWNVADIAIALGLVIGFGVIAASVLPDETPEGR